MVQERSDGKPRTWVIPSEEIARRGRRVAPGWHTHHEAGGPVVADDACDLCAFVRTQQEAPVTHEG